MALVHNFSRQLSRISSTATRTYFSSRNEIPSTYNTNEDILKFQDAMKKCIDTHINPFVDKWEAEGVYPAHSIFKKLGDLGVFGIDYPTEYGGMNLDYRFKIGATEALANIKCGGIPMSVSVQMDMSTPALARFGSQQLKEEFLVPSIAGDYVSSIAVSEPHAGSDVAATKTTAKRIGDDLIINGQKTWITNAPFADWICLLANTSTGEKSFQNKSLICLPMKTPGIAVGKKIQMLGQRSSSSCPIMFEDVRISARHIIGDEGKGFLYQMLQFQQERLSSVAITVASLEMCINETIEYTKDRHVFGKPVLCNQVVHFRLAELLMEVEMLKSLLHRAVDKVIAGEDATMLASMAKLKAGRLSREVTDTCLQYYGGMGYTNEVNVSRLFRDLRVVSIGAGSDEVMLGIICKLAGILPREKK